MEKVTAYKAFNGRLFDTEEKCTAYEKKMSMFPIYNDTITLGVLYDAVTGDSEPFSKIVRHEVLIKNSPRSKVKKEVHYVVDDRYRLTCPINLDRTLMKHFNTDCHYGYGCRWADLFRDIACLANVFAAKVLNGMEWVAAIEETANEFQTYNKDYDIVVRKVSDSVYTIEDKRWQRGICAPNRLTIELLEKV